MKKILITFLIIATLFITVLSADPPETVQPTCKAVATASADASALTTSTSSWAAARSWVEIPDTFNGLKVMFYAYLSGGSPDNATFSYQFYVAEEFGNAQPVASGTATVGASQMSHNPVTGTTLNSGLVNSSYCWVDTLGTITTDWFGGVNPQNNDGGDNVACFIFDRQTAKKMYCRIYNRSNANLIVYCVAYGY